MLKRVALIQHENKYGKNYFFDNDGVNKPNSPKDPTEK